MYYTNNNTLCKRAYTKSNCSHHRGKIVKRIAAFVLLIVYSVPVFAVASSNCKIEGKDVLLNPEDYAFS